MAEGLETRKVRAPGEECIRSGLGSGADTQFPRLGHYGAGSMPPWLYGDNVHIHEDIVRITSTAWKEAQARMSKETLGELEELVLLAMVRLGDQAYGLSIAEELQRTAGRPVVRASVYVLLRRLEKAGLIRSRRERDGTSRGQPRRYVEVTDEGVDLLRRARDVKLRMWDGIEDRLEPT